MQHRWEMTRSLRGFLIPRAMSCNTGQVLNLIVKHSWISLHESQQNCQKVYMYFHNNFTGLNFEKGIYLLHVVSSKTQRLGFIEVIQLYCNWNTYEKMRNFTDWRSFLK